MAKILSQDEVDALLTEFSGDQPAQGSAPVAEAVPTKLDKKEKIDDKQVMVYNFRRPDRISKDQLRSLHYMHDRFARNFASSLSAYLRALVDVSLYSVEQFTYAEFILSLPDPTYFNVLSLVPLEGSAILEMNPNILFPMIDKILGGKGESLSGGQTRAVTEIEKELISGVIQLILRDLENTWKQIIKLKMTVVATETSPQLVQVISPNEIVVLVVFELRVGEAKGFMNLCIPAIALEPIAYRFNQDWYSDKAKTSIEDIHRLRMNLLKSQITVEAGIFGNQIPIQELLTLEVGDCIQLGTKLDQEFSIKINGVNKYQGFPVQVGEKKGLQILQIIPREFKND